MRLIALLSWWDEHPAWLAELVGSLAGCGVEHIVACDGAYGLFPGARGSSGSEQSNVVIGAAHGAGMGVTVHVPAHPWGGNETEKRTTLFALGHLVAEPGDWFVVPDGDEVWKPAPLHALLEDTAEDVAEVMLVERDQEHGESRSMVRKCFRAHPGGIRVEGLHCRYVDGDGRDLFWGEAPVPAAQLWDVRVLHRPGARGAVRTQRRLLYYERRTEYGVEAVA